MSNLIQIKVAELNQLNPLMIAEDNRVEQKFIQMYNAIWGTAQGAQIYEKEKFNFRKILQDKPELQKCTPLSLYGCFLDIAVNGLSLDPTGRPHCYILPRSTKTGYKDNNGSDIYELRAYLSITGYGELVMRQRAGQVRYVDNPVVCYEGDTFSPGLIDGVKTVTYQAACPRKSNKVIGGFLRIVRSDGTVDWHWMMEGDIKRLEAYSFKNNQKWNPQTRQKEGKANAFIPLAKEVLIRDSWKASLSSTLSTDIPRYARDSSPHSRHRRNRKRSTTDWKKQPLSSPIKPDSNRKPSSPNRKIPYKDSESNRKRNRYPYLV
jgi:recombinational DNA repair protein RecT